MDPITVAIIAGGLLGFSLVSGRLAGTVVTPPLVFIAFGFAIGDGGLALAAVDPGHEGLHVLAEVTLLLVLFSDAARIDLARLRGDHDLPLRMLVLGLPLTLAAGTLAAAALFPALGLWEAALLAALLAPTDAALGQAVVSDGRVPVRIRQAINVESGLNDGIALPAVLLLAALAGAESESSSAGEWAQFAALQVTLGPLAGVAVGYLGARALDAGADRGWVTTSFQGIGILGLALLAFALAEVVGGNGFIAAFVAGMVFGNTVRHPCSFLYEFMETEGQLLMLVTFLVFGAALLPEGLHHLDWRVMLYAAVSLTVVRMVPVALSLAGAGLRLPTMLFLGWFGPRGLASILFVLLIVEQAGLVNRELLLSVTVVTVGLSALAHGVTAVPFARLYGRLAERMGECEENREAAEMPLRAGPIGEASSR